MSSLYDTITKSLAPVHREGRPFIAIAAAAALFLGWFFTPLFWIFLFLTGFIAFFFRDPRRVTAVHPGILVSPADGRVSKIGQFTPPPELGLSDEPMQRISIFMSVFDVHVNRAPISGRLARIAYKPGIFLNADLDKASEDNERNSLIIETDEGARIGVVQIAGLVARRIVSFVREGENVEIGQRFGLIRFGSRLDIYLPEGATALVAEGQRALAGETEIADLSGARAAPAATRES
ncbi:MAG: phosphatidylserine decarboxylase family protein [Hyphomicrobiales bacterium]|nr:MAG: phosphatidylserine decarboxylase family protein [Hyphomicrobiales bacterium]